MHLFSTSKKYKIKVNAPLNNREAWLLYEAYKRIDGTPESKEHYFRMSHSFFHSHERELERKIQEKVQKQQNRLDKKIGRMIKKAYKKSKQ